MELPKIPEYKIPDQNLKADKDKVRLDLIPPHAIEAVGRVLTFGATKYKEDSWKQVEPKRYKASVFRHFISYMKGEKRDPETGESHLIHAICGLIFLFEMDRTRKPNTLKLNVKKRSK